MKKTFYFRVLTLFLLILAPTLSSIITPSNAQPSSYKRALPAYSQPKDNNTQTVTLASPNVQTNSLLPNTLQKKQQSQLPAKTFRQSFNTVKDFNFNSVSQTLSTLQKKYNEMTEKVSADYKNLSNIDNGLNNKIDGNQNFIQKGNNNQINGYSNLVDGNNNTIKGRNNLVLGEGNVILDAIPANFTKTLNNAQQTKVVQNTELMDLVPIKNEESSALLYSSKISQPKSSQKTAMSTQISAKAIQHQQTHSYTNQQSNKSSQTQLSETGSISNKNLKSRDITLDQQATSSNTSIPAKLKEKGSQTIATDHPKATVSLGDKYIAKVVSLLLILWVFCL